VSLRIYTIGHSTRSADEFVGLLGEFEVERLVDIRQYPGSRRLPHFNREALESGLARAGIAYEWLGALGGRRRAARPDSPNMALRHPAFRNYADYMLTPEFRAGIGQLIEWAREKPTSIMCAEAVYWRCHRRLVSDYLVGQGIEVQHIMGPGHLRPHALTSGAVIRGGNVIYPQETLFE
jgi:uncharacterized protein (DUF488 family)